MRQFFKYVFATIVGLLAFSVLSLIFWVVVVSALSSAGDTKTEIAKNAVLKLNLDSPIQERGVDSPFNGLGPFSSDGNVIGLTDLKKALANAKADPNIKGIYLQSEYPQAGWATLEEIRNALIDFKQSKKFVYSYAEVMTEKGYYLASVADKIYLNPAGGMEWNGLNAELTFFKGTLDKLGIKPEIFRVGEFKSAVEPFFREDMSPANRLQFTSFLSSINNQMVLNVAKSRGLRVDSLRQLADNLTIDSPEDALRAKLVTNVAHQDELEADIRKVLGIKETKKIDYVSLGKYEDAESHVKEGSSKNRIAVIIAEGDINSGKSSDDGIGSETVVEELRKARLDDKVKAVVLRVSSGGGSALASDVMQREVELIRKVKPIVGSMGDYAASGGYYMLMGCNKLVAQPNTITGSIGVFGLLFNTETFFKDKLGITYDRVLTNANSDFPALTHTMSPFQKQVLQRGVERTYATFTGKVAKSRNLPIDSVRAIAGGRVWTGTQAKAIGLVDMLGGLDVAVAEAAKAAKLKDGDYKLKFKAKKQFFDKIMESFGNGGDEETRLRAQLGELAPYITYLKKLKTMEGVQARLPFEMEIK
jgi:protease IV